MFRKAFEYLDKLFEHKIFLITSATLYALSVLFIGKDYSLSTILLAIAMVSYNTFEIFHNRRTLDSPQEILWDIFNKIFAVIALSLLIYYIIDHWWMVDLTIKKLQGK